MTRALRVSAALLLTLVNVAGRAGAQTSADKAAAEELFRQGRMLTKDRRFTEACAKFADSQRLDPAVGTELNLARCYEDNGQTASAWALYNDVAVVAHRAGQLDRARLALRRAADLEKRLSRLTIEVASNDGAEGFAVQRDGKVVGQSEWNTPIPIDPGDHTVVATASGRRAWSTRVTVASGGGSLTVSVPVLAADDTSTTIQSVGSAAGTTTTRATSPESPPELGHRLPVRTIGLVIGGVGVAALSIAGILGLVAESTYNSAHCPRNSNCDSQGLSATASAYSDATASTVVFTVGAAALAGGVVLYFWPKSWSEPPPHAQSTRLWIRPGVREPGVLLGGSW
jgi:hypothetical protein